MSEKPDNDTLGVPPVLTNEGLGKVLGLSEAMREARANEAMNIGLDAVEAALASTPAQRAVAAMTPPKGRHVQYVEITCLDCGWRARFGFPVPEARTMRRVAVKSEGCPKCHARRLVGTKLVLEVTP